MLRFVDRDMFMRFLGGGIGHKATDHLQQRAPTCVHDEAPDPQDGDSIPHNTQDHTQADVDGGCEEVDTDEEADYGYADGPESEGEDSEGSTPNSEEEVGEGEEEADAADDGDETL